jgi:hypothetical protein
LFARSPPEENEAVLSNNLVLIRRLLFSRSLRLLPLAEQVGAVEALTFIVEWVPGVLPLSDQNLLAFLSELLKMFSVADGEMSDSNLSGFVVDKNGFVGLPDDRKTKDGRNVALQHSSCVFLRRECILKIQESRFVIPEESTAGIQLRISALALFRSVIKRHNSTFFDSENATNVGEQFSGGYSSVLLRFSRYPYHFSPTLWQEISDHML